MVTARVRPALAEGRGSAWKPAYPNMTRFPLGSANASAHVVEMGLYVAMKDEVVSIPPSWHGR